MVSIKRPDCPNCFLKMHRVVVNEYNGRTNEALPIGWFCKVCDHIILDLKPNDK